MRIAHDKHEMALIKYDFNLNDVSNLQSAKIYVCFKKDNIETISDYTKRDGHLLEIMFLSEVSYILIKIR